MTKRSIDMHKINITYDIFTVKQPLVTAVIKKCIEATLAAEGVAVPCEINVLITNDKGCLLYTSPSPRD